MTFKFQKFPTDSYHNKITNQKMALKSYICNVQYCNILLVMQCETC